MPTRTTTPAGAPTWIDLMTSDTDRARAFYGELFGWTSEVGGPEHGGYITFSRDGVPVAGCFRNQAELESPDVWSVYLASTDAKATVDAVTEAGGTVYSPAMDVSDLGVMAIVGDPTGATVGVWEAREHGGFGVVEEPGAPSWFELHTRDLEGAIAFYEQAFGWTVEVAADEPGFRYRLAVHDGAQVAGVMDASAFLPDGAPSCWGVYFAVEDADATIERAVAFGATVLLPAEDTPYGRLAELADPTGARFKLQG